MSSIRLTVREAFESRNLKRYQVSKMTGIPYQTLSRYYFDDVAHYDSDVLLKLCIALDCDLNELIEITKDETEGPSE